MHNKPITPLAHCLVDYGFTAAQWVLPPVLGLNKKAVNLYRILGLNLCTYTALTKTQVGVKPLISFKTHGDIDRLNLVALGLAGFYSGIRKQRKALLFHTLFLSAAVLNVLLTNWDEHKST